MSNSLKSSKLSVICIFLDYRLPNKLSSLSPYFFKFKNVLPLDKKVVANLVLHKKEPINPPIPPTP